MFSDNSHVEKDPEKGQQKIPNSYAYILQSRWCNSIVLTSAHFGFQSRWIKMLTLSVLYRIAITKAYVPKIFNSCTHTNFHMNKQFCVIKCPNGVLLLQLFGSQSELCGSQDEICVVLCYAT